MKLLSIISLFLSLLGTALAQESLDCSSLGFNSENKIRTLEDTDNVDCLILQHYRQTKFNANDPLSDMALACLAHNYPKRIVWAFKKKTSANDPVVKKFYEQAELGRKCSELAFEQISAPEISFISTLQKWGDMEDDFKLIREMDLNDAAKELVINRLLDGKFALDGTKDPLNAKGFLKVMNQIIKEESHVGLAPKTSTHLDWSHDFKSFVGKRFNFYTKKSKLLIALASGESIKYMKSGKEQELYQFMMKQSENSLYPHELFRASYRINQGDVYLSILTIQNLLSQHWLVPNRNKIDFITKLHPITHHLGSNEDVFGTWYHLFGSMLYGYSAGQFYARLVTKIETIMSVAYSGGSNDYQENRINQQGAIIGARLKKSLRREDWKTVSEEIIKPENYLVNPSFRKGKIKL